ncbi:hypothetical protein LOC68_25220 [Blastopirellula sp. JC732]|uniref:Uncharacterized protein n=1 Tax=Blastopirellula sediminis TaxID=2894196 RepID=A0A9X1MS23_9BACT|nr:hypothetical protein [Blastopirellula sediminis]MCC9604989.1 hypothetical protein [Blastopirellula sediminis]MCC9631711.1 hypothetical protein [Blastopirellula sediminis]
MTRRSKIVHTVFTTVFLLLVAGLGLRLAYQGWNNVQHYRNQSLLGEIGCRVRYGPKGGYFVDVPETVSPSAFDKRHRSAMQALANRAVVTISLSHHQIDAADWSWLASLTGTVSIRARKGAFDARAEEFFREHGVGFGYFEQEPDF